MAKFYSTGAAAAGFSPVQPRAGFTLVELAIVITIIGILIGGVLKGQQLIDQAKMASVISQVRNYQTALGIFSTTYDSYPGDMTAPDDRIVGCNGCRATAGTQGDGMVVGANFYGDSLSKGSEATRFWLQLSKANMISGVSDAALDDSTPVAFGETHPAAKIGHGFYAASGTGYCCTGDAHCHTWGNCHPDGLTLVLRNTLTDVMYHAAAYNSISPAQAAQIDRKMDDGKPLSGDVRGASRGGTAGNGCAGGENQSYPEAATEKSVCTVAFVID